MSKIEQFWGEYRFLSNFHDHPLIFDGLIYRNSEAAYQAQKTEAREQRVRFTKLLPGEAKRLGRCVTLRDDWNDVRLEVMLAVCRAKFADPELMAMLLNTGDAELIEGNTWGDRFWGVVDGSGANNLGKILMRIRAEALAEVEGTEVLVDHNAVALDENVEEPEETGDAEEVDDVNVDDVNVDDVNVDDVNVDKRRGKRKK